MWEHTRGVGYSFGYNQLEDESQSLNGTEAITHVVSRRGNLLLNVGLMADGTVPPVQRKTLTELAAWNAVNGSSVFGSVPLSMDIAKPSDAPWARWTRTDDEAHAFISTTDPTVTLELDPTRVDIATARFADGSKAEVTGVVLTMPAATSPVRVTFDSAQGAAAITAPTPGRL